MNNRFEIKDILVAVNELLDNNKLPSQRNHKSHENNVLLLNNEVKTKKNKDDVPLDTERIILEAEKFIKK